MASAPRRIPLLLVVVGIACCAIAVAGLGPVSGAQTADTTTQPQPTEDLALPERVVLDGEATHGTATAGRDVAAAIDRGSARADGSYDRALLVEELERAESPDERREILAAWAERLDRSVHRLEARERTARREYASGDRSASELLRTLRAVNDRAEQLELVADTLEEEADAVGAANVTSDVEALRGALVALQGPVRTHVSEAAAGESNATRVHVSATENGTVLATVDGREYHREAVRNDLLQARGSDGLPSGELFDLTTRELYPNHNEHYTFFSPGRTIVLFQLYGIEAYSPHYPHGELRSYVDGVSETVFWEYHRLDLDEDMPTASTHTRRVNDTTVVIERTYPSGPARVAVRHGDRPVDDAAVALDGTTLARTDEQGVAWIVLPEDAETLQVSYGAESAETDVSW